MELLIVIVIAAGAILVLRLLGAWMLRINDVIRLQKDILQELKKMNESAD
jgi:hypothetical protein